MARVPLLHTVTYYGIARLRALVTSRSIWTVLVLGCILVLAVMGTSVAWRTRTGGTEESTPTTALLQTPVVDHTPSEAVAPSHPAARDVTIVSSSPVYAAPAASPAAFLDSSRTGVSTTAPEEGRTQCEAEQQPRTTSSQLVVSQTAVDSATQRTKRSRVRKTPAPRPAFSRTRTTERAMSLPAVSVMSVSSTAALIQRGHERQMIQRGTRLNGWTVTRLTPSGLRLRRGQQQAVVPLSFTVHAASAR